MTKYIPRKSLFFYWVSIILALASGDMDFFPDIKGNLTKITWAHAVNTQSDLKAALNNSRIMMIEGDVRVGTVANNANIVPIMAHDGNTSDLSLSDFLSQVKKSGKKGVKLDFKLIDAFNKSKDILPEYYQENTFPIWLNADILKGNGNPTSNPVNATEFLDIAHNLAISTLSIGWTTIGNDSFPYTKQQTDDMMKQLKQYNFSTPITFPVRAVLAAKSVDVLTDLVSSCEKTTLTIWSSAEDHNIDIDGLRSLIHKVGIEKTYIDVPDSLLSELHLESINGVGKTVSLSCLTVTLVALFSVLLNI